MKRDGYILAILGLGCLAVGLKSLTGAPDKYLLWTTVIMFILKSPKNLFLDQYFVMFLDHLDFTFVGAITRTDFLEEFVLLLTWVESFHHQLQEEEHFQVGSRRVHCA